MTHAHLLVFFDVPKNFVFTPAIIDDMISAELPPPTSPL
jgi:hypothetical protein